MKIVLDLQICQLHDEQHPACRLLFALLSSLAQATSEHEVHLLLNALLPESIGPLRQKLEDLVPPSQIHVFSAVAPVDCQSADNQSRAVAAQCLRENFLANLRPDVVLAAHPFYGFHDQTVHSVARLGKPFPVVLMFNGIPQDNPVIGGEQMPAYLNWRQHAFQSLINADTLIALSEQAVQAAEYVLQIPKQRIAVLSITEAKPDCDEDIARIQTALQQAAETYSSQPNASLMLDPPLRLAYVSPLPPQQTGIADYSAMLLPQLSRYYRIDVVCDQDLPLPGFSVIGVDEFKAHADRYDRIVYHFGNSKYHRHMFELLADYPGVVVLHDFYLSHVVASLEFDGFRPNAFRQALYHSHGYPALMHQQYNGLESTIWEYPCNAEVLQQANGVIVHSHFAKQLARQFYREQAAQDWFVVPLARLQPVPGGRAAAREQLDLGPDDFMICSFGLMGVTKLNHRLLQAWLDSALVHDNHCHLVFVGGADKGQYGQTLAETIAACPCPERIHITGYVTEEQYKIYLAAADLAVQLRGQTRGETSAAILDCLSYGLAAVVNANGSAAELADEVLCKLPDEFSDAELSEAIYQLRIDAERRQALAIQAKNLLSQAHHPAAAAQQYQQAIEIFYSSSPQAHYRHLLQTLQTQPKLTDSVDPLRLAYCIAENQPSERQPIIWVDVSAMVLDDLKTGIQRVVRSIAMQLLASPPSGYRVEPVYDDKGCYRHACRYTQQLFGQTPVGLADTPVLCHSGDIFLGLDLYIDGIRRNQPILEVWRSRGVRIAFVIYDLLPVLQSAYFPPDAEAYFKAWLQTLAAVADQLICISAAVSDEVRHWLDAENLPTGKKKPVIGHFHLGADIEASVPSYGIDHTQQQVLQQIQGQTNLLIVGTVEPRKGHAQALAACELLWQQGQEINLIIVGKQGWMVRELADRLQKHPQNGRHLFWFQGISDEFLAKLYQTASALLAASEGEGFGLPLIEAAQHQLPVIARDLPVFIEVAGEHAYYFSGKSPEALAEALSDWQALKKAGNVPLSNDMPWLTWQQSAQQLLDNLLE